MILIWRALALVVGSLKETGCKAANNSDQQSDRQQETVVVA